MRTKPSLNDQIGLEWETASVPLIGGLDARSNRKMRSPEKLIELNNGRFVERASIGKRAGHVGSEIAGLEYAGGGADAEWTYGLEKYDVSAGTSHAPGQAKGVFNLNGTLVAWTGDRLYTKGSDDIQWNGQDFFFQTGTKGFYGILPHCVEAPFAFPGNMVPHSVSAAKGTRLQVTAWRSGTSVYVRVVDHTTGEILPYSYTSVYTGLPEHVRVIALEGKLVVLWNDTGSSDLYWLKVNENDASLTAAAVRQGNVIAWDTDKVDDDNCLLVWMEAGFVMRAEVFNSTSTNGTWLASNTVLDPDGHAPAGAKAEIACSVTGDNSFAVVWCEGATATPPIRARAYNDDGTPAAASVEVHAGGTDTVVSFSVSNRRVNDQSWGIAYTVRNLTVDRTLFKTFAVVGGLGSGVQRFQVRLMGKLFSVGEVIMCLTVSRPASNLVPVQSTYHLMAWAPGGDQYLRPCAIISKGEAALPPAGVGGGEEGKLSFDFLPGQSAVNRYQWFGLVTEREGNYVIDAAGTTGSIETKGRYCDINFMPQLRAAQVNKAAYIAGACPQVFDGAKITEAGFYDYPQVTALAGSNGAGLLTADGTYRYRVYFCRKMSDGLIFRSPALTSAPYTLDTAGLGEDTITIDITTLPLSGDPDVYYEVYRTEDGGSTFYLISGLNPAVAPQNDISAATISFVDTMSDATARTMPVDPHAASLSVSEIEEAGMPGCEGVFYLNDRLWCYGGSIEAGKVQFSKNMEIGEGTGFEDGGVLEYSIDRSGKRVTAVGSLQSIPVIFRDDDIFAIAGNGPDNFGLDSFALPRFVPTDQGCVNQEALAQVPEGLVFWSASGPRMLTNGLQVQIIGDEITPLIEDFECVGTIVVPDQSQVRFYGRDNRCFVWDYTLKLWSLYTGLAAEGVCYYNRGAALARANGVIFMEEEGVWTDGGASYEFSLCLGDLSKDALIQGAHRFRRWALAGEWKGAHTLLVEVWKNGSDVLSERMEWDPAVDIGYELWGLGGGLFGGELLGVPVPSSIWPDADASQDGVYRTRRRFKATTQKASLIRMRFSDQGATNNSFVASEIAFELGVKPGLSRLPARTFGDA